MTTNTKKITNTYKQQQQMINLWVGNLWGLLSRWPGLSFTAVYQWDQTDRISFWIVR